MVEQRSDPMTAGGGEMQFLDQQGVHVIEDIYHVPEIDDIAGIIVRGRFSSQEEADAAVLFFYVAEMSDSDALKELGRNKVASTASLKGIRSSEALMGGTGMIAPDIYRIAMGIPKAKKGEEDRVIKRTDIPSQQYPEQGIAGGNGRF